MSTWYTADTPAAQLRVKGAWADAPVHNAELLGMLLSVAKYQVLEFAPEAAPPPVYEPATLTWANGQKITFSRDADTVTAVVDPTAVTGALDHTAKPFPAAHFGPRWSVSLFWLAAPEYQVAVGDTQINIITISPNVAPFPAATVQWLGEAATGDGVPDNYVLAQLMQVRNLWNAGRTTGDGEVGADGFVFRPYPLDNTIKAVIRPINWSPHVL